MAMIFLVGTMSLGIVISIVAKNQLLANQMAMMLTYVPSFLLSGFVFPISNMPRVVQIVTYFVPARFFIAILKGIYLKGVGLEILAVEALLLTVFAVGMVALANVLFKKKLQ
jgi:ABC-2 type transport system permease protein